MVAVNSSDPPISETSEATPSEATKRLNQWSAEVIARREQEAAEAAAKKAAEDKIRLEQINAVMAKNRILAFNCGKPRNPLYPEIREPNPLQKQLLDAWKNPQYRTFLYSSGNRGGKTTIGVLVTLCMAAGEWLWNAEKIPFPHTHSRKIRIVGHAWESHIKSVLMPALKFWIPESQIWKTRKNNQGIDATWELWSRSHDKGLIATIEIMSNTQDVSVFEGWHGDLVYYDEPPKRDVRIACARGLIDRSGRELFSCTLINEAWIMRDIIRAADDDGQPDPSVFYITGSSYTNLGYGITNASDIEQFSKMLTEDERKARIDGVPFNMSSLLCPRFDRKIHIKERFKIPLDALIQISIDWHPSKPLVVVFMATLSNGMKYVCDEMQIVGNPTFAADEVIRLVRERGYTRIDRIIIDPLSKSGAPNDNDVYSIFSERFAAFGYGLETASKEKESGLGILNSWLWTVNECPRLLFFRDCKKTISEIENLMFDPETLKPVKEKDDHFECLYRLCLLDTDWYEQWELSKGTGRSVVL